MSSVDFSSFEKALYSLDKVLKRSLVNIEDEDLRDACIQRFEYTYELSIKMLRRVLEQSISLEELDLMNFQDFIRTGAEKGLIADPKQWFEFRKMRNTTSHGYDEAKAKEIYQRLQLFIQHVQDLLKKLKQYAH